MKNIKKIFCLLIFIFTMAFYIYSQNITKKDSLFGIKLNKIISDQLNEFIEDQKERRSSDSIELIVHLQISKLNLSKEEAVFSIQEICWSGDLYSFPPIDYFQFNNIIAIVYSKVDSIDLKYINIKKIDSPTMRYITSFYPGGNYICLVDAWYTHYIKVKNKRIKVKKILKQ